MEHLLGVLLLFFMLTGCTPTEPPIVSVALQSKDKAQEIFYESVWADGTRASANAFVSDELQQYQVDCFGFDCQVVDGTVQNTVSYVSVTNERGEQVDDIVLRDMVYAASAIDHNIFRFTILEDQGQYFCWINLNTNWSDPYQLYRYDPDINYFQLLYQWDSVDLIGLQLPDNTDSDKD